MINAAGLPLAISNFDTQIANQINLCGWNFHRSWTLLKVKISSRRSKFYSRIKIPAKFRLRRAYKPDINVDCLFSIVHLWGHHHTFEKLWDIFLFPRDLLYIETLRKGLIDQNNRYEFCSEYNKWTKIDHNNYINYLEIAYSNH